MRGFSELLARLDEVKIFNELKRLPGGAIAVDAYVPGQCWRITWVEDRLEVIKYMADGVMHDEEKLEELLQGQSDALQKIPNDLARFMALLNLLEEAKIHYELKKIRTDAIMAQVVTPNQFWEIELSEGLNGYDFWIEVFTSDGVIYGESELEVLFREFSN